jgi:hypothetical protein
VFLLPDGGERGLGNRGGGEDWEKESEHRWTH